MSNIVDLRSWRKSEAEQEPVTYTIHITQYPDGELDTFVEDVDDEPDTDAVMHLLELIVNSHKLQRYAEYLIANMTDTDEE